MSIKKEKVVIIGAGGLAREVYWAICEVNGKSEQAWEVVGYIDENPDNWEKRPCGIPVLGDFSWFETNKKDQLQAICAVGSPKSKKSLVDKALKAGLEFCTIVHPDARHSDFINTGKGTVITAGCILTTQITIGNHVYLNLNTTIGHDVVIKDFVNVNPGCHISGNVTVNEGADLGTGAVILPGITIGAWATVGAGAVVTSDVPPNTLVTGIPAKAVKSSKE